jgi:hypothetical protein
MFGIEIAREQIFAGIAVIISVIRYATYFRAMYLGKARPHMFTWFSWGLTMVVAVLAQYKLGGGPSIWPMIVVAGTCLFISGLAYFVGEKNITRSDWVALASVFISTALWQITDNPAVAVFFLIITDVFSYYPTFRKSWSDPWGEPPVSYIWAGSRYFFTLFAVPDPTIANMAYIFFSMLSDWALAAFIFWRRKKLKQGNMIGIM